MARVNKRVLYERALQRAHRKLYPNRPPPEPLTPNGHKPGAWASTRAGVAAARAQDEAEYDAWEAARRRDRRLAIERVKAGGSLIHLGLDTPLFTDALTPLGAITLLCGAPLWIAVTPDVTEATCEECLAMLDQALEEDLVHVEERRQTFDGEEFTHLLIKRTQKKEE